MFVLQSHFFQRRHGPPMPIAQAPFTTPSTSNGPAAMNLAVLWMYSTVFKAATIWSLLQKKKHVDHVAWHVLPHLHTCTAKYFPNFVSRMMWSEKIDIQILCSLTIVFSLWVSQTVSLQATCAMVLMIASTTTSSRTPEQTGSQEGLVLQRD